MSLPSSASAPVPLSTPSRPRPRPHHRSSGGGGGGSFDANASLDSTNPLLAGLSLSGFTPGGAVPVGYSYLDKAAPSLRTSTRTGPRDAAAATATATTHKKKAPRPATRFIPPRSTSPVSPHDRAIPPLVASPSPPRSKTVPSLSSLNASLASLSSLPTDPRHWNPTHVSLYLSHVLSLAPRPVIEDVARFVRAEQLSGPGFLRLREGQLESKGMNPRWRRLLCEASERLRRDALRRRIWSRQPKDEDAEEEPSMQDLLGDDASAAAGQLTPGQQRLMTATLKRIRDRKAVRGLIDAIESSPPKGSDAELPSSPSLSTPTRKIKKNAFPSIGESSLERSSPSTTIEPPFGEGYVRRQANSFSSQENLAQAAREGAKAQRIRPSAAGRKWASSTRELEQSEPILLASVSKGALTDEFGARPTLTSSISSPAGELAWSSSRSAHVMSASSSSSSSISTSTSASSITSARGYESDFSASSEDVLTESSDAGGYDGEEQQPADWLTMTMPIDEELVRAMLLEEQQDEGAEEATFYEQPGEAAVSMLEAERQVAKSVAEEDDDEEERRFQSSHEEPELEVEPLKVDDELDEQQLDEVGQDEYEVSQLKGQHLLTASEEAPFPTTMAQDQSLIIAPGAGHDDKDDVFCYQRHEEQEHGLASQYEHDVEATVRAPRRDGSATAMAISGLLLHPNPNSEEEGERFDTIRLDEDSLATIRQARRGVSSGSSQGSEDLAGRGRRSLQLSEMFVTPGESEAEEKQEQEGRMGGEVAEEEAAVIAPEEQEVAVEIEQMLEELGQREESAMSDIIDEAKLERRLGENQAFPQDANIDDEDDGQILDGELCTAAGEQKLHQLDLVPSAEDDKKTSDGEPTSQDLFVPVLEMEDGVTASGETDVESSLEDSTILHLIHTREVSTASASSSCTPDAFSAAAATIAAVSPSKLEEEEMVKNKERNKTDDEGEQQQPRSESDNPNDSDAPHIWYGDASPLLLLSSLLPSHTADELLLSEHRRLLPSTPRGASSPSNGEKRQRDGWARATSWSWSELVARTPPYLVGLATGVAVVVVSEMVLGLRRRR